MRGSNAAELAADIEERVAVGSLRPGDRLPPVRTLASHLGLAPNTVAAAYRRLGERGIVIGKGRAGSFIAPRPPVALPGHAPVPAGLLDLSSGNPDPLLLPRPARLPAPGPPLLYGSAPMDDGLREAGGAWLTADGVPAENLTVVSGALDGIERVLGAHLRPGDRVAVEDPAYASVIDLLGSMGLVPVPMAIDDEGPQPDALTAALSGGAAAAVLTPRAQNPFGSAITAGRAARLGEVFAEHPGVLVVEDDHASAVAGMPVHPIAPARERWAVVRSVAKAYAPDLRLALLAGDAATVRRVEGRLRLGPGWVSHILQRLAAGLLTDDEVASQVESAALVYGERRRALVDALAATGVGAHAASGLNVWIPVSDEAAAVAGMRDFGIAVRAGSRFRLRSGPGIRVTVAALDEPQRSAVVAALAGALAPGPLTRSG